MSRKLTLYSLKATIFLMGFTTAALSQSVDTVPRLKSGECKVDIPKGVKAECFDLTVRESRTTASDRTITLPVIIIKSTAASPQPDPVIYTAGGPGVGSLGMVRGAANLVPYTNQRDFIIFEQRGTQYSKPSLQCPEVTEALRANRELNRDPKASATAEVAAAKACRQRLVNLGIDLSSYNSVQSAADIDDLRRLLRIDRWNLYGISYSTRLMVNYVRDHPQNVRSIILDSVLPTTANWDETGIENVMAALKRLFESCASDQQCVAKYPGLEKQFYLAAEQLDRSPVTVTPVINGKTVPVKLIGRDFVDLIYNLLEGTNSLKQIPWTIDAVNTKNYEPLTAYAENSINSSGFIWGMRFSVWCSEEMPFQNQAKIAAAVKRDPRLLGFSIQGTMPQICKVWNVRPAKPVENKAVNIGVPVLAFAGEFDPDTPPGWSRMVASWSDHGYFFQAKNTSHAAMNRRCTFVDIPVAFLNDPYKRPDGKCLDSYDPIVFR